MEYRGSIDSNEDIASRGIINDMLVIRLTGLLPTGSTVAQTALSQIGLTFDKMKALAKGKYIGVIESNGTLYVLAGAQYTNDSDMEIVLKFENLDDVLQVYDFTYNGTYWNLTTKGV